MNDEILTRERILDATEDVLRRFGPAKTTVVDVARALGVTHGSVYRHFASKAALQDAVAERWLAALVQPLDAVLENNAPALVRLRRWFDVLMTTKRRSIQNDPEMFATYHKLVESARDVVQAHVKHLVEQLERIISDGVAAGEFQVADSATTARALFNATIRFHNPVHAAQWNDPDIDDAFEAVWNLIVSGLGVTSA